MAQPQIIKKILILSAIFFLGCNATDKPLFDLPTIAQTSTNQARIEFRIGQEALPSDNLSSFVITESELPDNSVYMTISQVNPQSSYFLLNVNVKNIIGIYDLALVVNYNPNLIDFEFSSTNNTLIEGPLQSRLRKFLPEDLMTLLVVPNPNEVGQIIISHSLLQDLGESQKYNGLLFSIPFQAIAPGSFNTPIGFSIGTSDVINRDGNPMDIQFFGGTILHEI